MARHTRRDALPEHSEYRDTGCSLAPSCLRCPLPACRFDMRDHRAPSRTERDAQVAAMASRATVNETAAAFGVSRRTVFRVVAAAKKQR